MVGRRNTLLKYLKAKSPPRFDEVVKRLGLRAG
jgi:ribosomal protein S15P/S13E